MGTHISSNLYQTKIKQQQKTYVSQCLYWFNTNVLNHIRKLISILAKALKCIMEFYIGFS